MKGTAVFKKIALIIYRYFVFFAPVTFVLTCNITLFLNLLSHYADIKFTRENIQVAAVFTFWNAAFLAFIYAIIDYFRRKISVEKPVNKIHSAAEKIMQGDFSVRIKPTRIPTSKNAFNPIINDFNKMAEKLSGIFFQLHLPNGHRFSAT